MKRVEKTTTTRERELPEDAALADLEPGLQIDENAMEEALLAQPDSYYKVSKRLALVISRRDAAKQELAEVEARADAKIRRDAELAEEKITEREVKSQKRLDTDVKTAGSNVLTLNYHVGELTALKEAFQQRSYALKELVALYIANYYGDLPSGQMSRQLRNVDATIAKDAMSKLRRKEPR